MLVTSIFFAFVLTEMAFLDVGFVASFWRFLDPAVWGRGSYVHFFHFSLQRCFFGTWGCVVSLGADDDVARNCRFIRRVYVTGGGQ